MVLHPSSGVALPGLAREARDHEPCPPSGRRRIGRWAWPCSSASVQPWLRVATDAFPTRPPPDPSCHRRRAARQAAQWLADRLTPQGFIPTTSGSGQPDLSSTAQGILAWSAANVDLPGARQALSYLQANVEQYVTAGGSDGPGQLSLLILDAEALGQNPRSFGGTNLVSRLLATEQTGGTDAGLFGTETQVATYSAGSYQQGLALAALASAGVHGTGPLASAVSWLNAEQCPDGGWTLPDQAVNPCTGTPATFEGPDTNSTSFAVEGLVAQGAAHSTVSAGALRFFTDRTGCRRRMVVLRQHGHRYSRTTQPTSTAFVDPGIGRTGGVADGGRRSPRGSATPVSALLTFQLTVGRRTRRALLLPRQQRQRGTSSPPTSRGRPDRAGRPLWPSGGSYWLAGADGSVPAFGNAGPYGSLPALGVSVMTSRQSHRRPTARATG